jgi:thymidylate synthase (FAD)
MNIVEPYARLLPPDFPNQSRYLLDGNAQDLEFHKADGFNLLRKIEACARVSHASEDKQTLTSWERFIKAVVIDHGDWSVVEHASVSVDFLVDRGITHELVRRRLFSFTQSSTRFINYAKKMPAQFIDPFAGEFNVLKDQAWGEAILAAEKGYLDLIERGAPPQIARSVLPNALASRIIVTGNLRNFRHLFIMRTTKETHPQFRQVTIPLLEEFQAKIPILFDDIKPMSRQIDNLRLPR